MKRFDFLKTLKERIVVLDGAMGTMLHAANLKAVDYGGADFGMLGDLLNISRPEEIKKVHRAYLEAGANAVETNTFGSSALRLKEYDFSKINKSAFGEFFDKRTAKVLDDYSISYLLSKKGAEIAGESLEEYSKEEGGALAKNSARYHPPKIKPFRKTSHTGINDLKINFKNLKNLNWKMAKEDETVFKKLAAKWIRRSKENNWIAPPAVYPRSFPVTPKEINFLFTA